MRFLWLILFVILPLFAVDIPQWKIIIQQKQSLTLELQLPLPTIVTLDGQQQIRIPQSKVLQTPGYPELPVVATLLQMPKGSCIQHEILAADILPIPNIMPTIAPTLIANEQEGNMAESSGTMDAVMTMPSPPIALAGTYPHTLFEWGEMSIMRGVTVVPLRVFPARWEPNTQTLQCLTRLQVKVSWDRDFRLLRREFRQDLFLDTLSTKIIGYVGPEQGIAVDSSMPSSGVAPRGIGISVTSNGLYRLTYQDLIGIFPASENINPQTFALLCQGQEVAIHIHCQNPTQWQADDYIEFYGQAVDTLYTGTNVYWLTWGQIQGSRMANDDSSPINNAPLITSFNELLHFEKNLTSWDNLPASTLEERWFWQKLTAKTSAKYNLSVSNPILNTTAQLSVSLKGRSTPAPHPNHHALFRWNTRSIGELYWDNIEEKQAVFEFSHTVNGNNLFEIQLPGDTGAALDIFYLNWVELKYQRQLKASNNTLLFEIALLQASQIEVSNFTSNQLRVFDITDPLQAKELQGFDIIKNGQTYTLSLGLDYIGTRRFLVIDETKIKKPHSLAFWNGPQWNNPQHLYSYIIITIPALQPALQPLITFHQSQGEQVAVVMMSDLYNEYNYGLESPDVIRSFLNYAYHHWQDKPKYILLVGGASSDYRNYLQTARQNDVPTHLSYTEVIGITPDDNWFACVDGTDELPDMMIGRIPANTPQQVTQAIEKILSPLTRKNLRGVFVTDNQEADFLSISNRLITYLPTGSTTTKIHLGTYGTNLDKATLDIITSFNTAPDLINYVGHSSTAYWTRQVFHINHIAQLQPITHYPLLMSWSCIVAHFANPNSLCLGQELLLANKKGPRAVLSFSGAASIGDHDILSKRLYVEMFQYQNYHLGSLWLAGKLEAFSHGSTEALRMFTLLGDPGSCWYQP